MLKRVPGLDFGNMTAPMQIDYPDGSSVLPWRGFPGTYQRVGVETFEEVIHD